MRRRGLHAAAMLTVLVASQPADGAQTAASKPAPLESVLASQLDASGWTREGPSRGFDAGNLWQYIDGDADRYVDAGLAEMRTATYRFRGTLEAVVDVYRMTQPEGARRIFRSEATGDGAVVELGDEARSSELMLVFRVGADFVRIAAYETTPETTDALRTLGRALAARLQANVSAPPGSGAQGVVR